MSRAQELTILIAQNDLQVYTSPELIAELKDVLSRSKLKKYLTEPIESYLTIHQQLTIGLNPNITFDQSPDPKDNYLFDVAIESEATHLVTGDKPLLNAKSLGGVKIISLADFKALFE